MPVPARRTSRGACRGFNEAAGADPADARARRSPRLGSGRFNEAAGADPADASSTTTVEGEYAGVLQ